MTKLFVFDTNSLISAAILPNSISRRAFVRAIKGGLLVVSEETMGELNTVLYRKKFDAYFEGSPD